MSIKNRTVDLAVICDEHWALVFDQLHLGFWELDPATGIVNSTASSRINLGFPADFNFRYQDLLSIIEPEDLDNLQDEIHLVIAGEKDACTVFYHVRHPNGKIRYLRADMKVAKENGELKIYGTNLDITEYSKTKKI